MYFRSRCIKLFLCRNLYRDTPSFLWFEPLNRYKHHRMNEGSSQGKSKRIRESCLLFSHGISKQTDLHETSGFGGLRDCKTVRMERVRVAPMITVPIYVPTEEIDQRNGGCGVIFENKLYVWGGNTADVRILKPVEDSDSSSNSDNDDSDKEDINVNLPVPVPVSLPRSNDKNHPFDVLDLTTNKWFRQSTSGEYPTLGLGSSLSVHHPSRNIILFSGFKKYFQFDNEVYKVSPDREWVWEKVEVMPEVKPRERYLSGVIIHKDRMCVFGGVGRASRKVGNPLQPQDPGAKYLAYVEDEIERDYGWTSEYLEFDINTSE